MRDGGDALAPGTRLEEFEIERVRGAGGFGVTYLARDVDLQRRVAVKEYLPYDWAARLPGGGVGPRSTAHEKDYRWGLERFLDEARILANLEHPHVVRVHRVIKSNGTAYMVMEYVEGRSLAEELAAGGRLPEARVRALLEALASGLETVHAAGLAHRDIKPANVMLRSDGSPVLIDFGAARQVVGRQSRALTSVLTPGYAPIEQYDTEGRQGPWTDVYSLGAVAYEALSGRAPTEAPGRVRRDPLSPLSLAAPSVSPVFAAAVDSALSVHAEDRPRSVSSWRAMWSGSSAVREASPRRMAYPVAAVALLVVAAGSAGWWMGGGGSLDGGSPDVETFRDCPECPELVVVPAGSFMMGSPASEEGRYGNEGPRHRVTIPSPFAVGVYEVMFAEWDACVADGGCGGYRPDDYGSGRGSRPVINVSWEDAQSYVGWLSRETGSAYRLLSESEWEYVARGGTTTSRYWDAGESVQCLNANGADESSGMDWGAPCDDGYGDTAPVGAYTANDFGLYDVLGNVWEWVEDCWHGDYAGAPSDGSAWTSGGDCGLRVLRGSSCCDDPRYLRSSFRLGATAGSRNGYGGFRVSRTLD